MCGLFGEIRFDGRAVDPGPLFKAGHAMVARGPDGAGLFQKDGTVLGHRRLRIIDLSEASAQPMVDNELGLAIAFNGAIYNYKELRAELEGKGYRFFAKGDTEVILKAYHAWGPDCVKRFHGMFAFAISERESGRVILARDRLGIKPLYLSDQDGGMRFASTLPALVAAGGVDTGIDPVALNYYLSFHAVVPAPYTILKGVRKLPPATVMVIEPDGQRKSETYWSLYFGPQPGDEDLTTADWEDKTLEALRLAVKRRLVADVPVGVLLSGGLDSSLIVGLLAEQGATGLETFSIGFESVGGESGDEFTYSDMIAEHFGTSHHKIPVETARVLPNLPKCIGAMAEPMVSHDVIGFYMLSQEVAKYVKVVQSGQGADEVFGGYHWYPPMMETNDAVGEYASVFMDRSHDEYRRTVADRFHGEDHARAFIEAQFGMPGANRPVDKTLRMDTTIMLVDDPVKRVDNMTMAASLEARVPFLDHELVELAARMPAELKLADDGKGILKTIGRRIIPPEVIDRPKGYFPMPALKYLRGPYLEMVRDAVNSDRAVARDLFRREMLDTLLDDPDAHITPLRGSKLWQLGLLQLWLDEHGL